MQAGRSNVALHGRGRKPAPSRFPATIRRTRTPGVFLLTLTLAAASGAVSSAGAQWAVAPPDLLRLPPTAAAGQLAQAQPAPDRQPVTEQDVERMLREAAGQPPEAPAGEQPKSLEQQIESLLQEGERRRSEAPPEVGAGLGARLAAFNPNISLIGDFIGLVSSAPDPPLGNPIRAAFFDEGDVEQFTFREVELLATAAIDPYSDGLVKLGFGPEGVEIEEAYALFYDYPFQDWLPYWMRDIHTKIGVFRMAFGPLNLVDEHDLPTVDQPLAIQQFLGEEGLIRPGVSFSKLLPQKSLWTRELIVELTDGEPMGDEPGSVPFQGVEHPLGLVRYKLFRSFEPQPEWQIHRELGHEPGRRDGRRTLELGVTFAATGTTVQPSNEDLYSLVEGFDLTWQWYDPRPDSYRQYLLQGEVFLSQLDRPADGQRLDAGGFLLGQVRWNRHWFSGLRLDLTEFPDRDGWQLAGTVTVTYFLTEFNRARLQYQYLRQQVDGPDSAEAHTVWVQLVFAYGAHPPEPYYLGQRF